jgi:hypothetical protein
MNGYLTCYTPFSHGTCADKFDYIYKKKLATFVSSNKFIMKIDLMIYLIILIIYHNINNFLYISRQSYFLGNVTDN